MPKYYHIHRSPTPSAIEKGLDEGHALYFSKKRLLLV